MKNKIETSSKKSQIVKSVKKKIFQERQTCLICGRNYKSLERHMRNAHRPPPSFLQRAGFCRMGLKHIFIVQTPFVILYLIPFPDLMQTILFYIIALFFIIPYMLYIVDRYPSTGKDDVSSYSYPSGIMFSTYLTMITYLNIHDSVSSLVADFIQVSVLAAFGKQRFMVPSPMLLLFFFMPAFWVIGCLSWEASIFRKRRKEIMSAAGNINSSIER